MKITNYNRVRLIFLLLAMICTAPVYAQTSDSGATEQGAEQTDAEKKQQETSADVRDAIHENLSTLHDDIDAATQQEVDSGKEPARHEAEQELQQDNEAMSYWQRILSIPDYLQSVPDRVPWIRESGLIFFGRVELDGAYYSSGITSGDSGFRVRSLRTGLAKAFKNNLSVKAEIDVTDGDNNFTDLYLRYNHKRFGIFTVGNQRVAQTLVNQTSRISRNFMEEPLPAEAFGLGRRLALGWDTHLENAGVHVTAFGPDLNRSIGDSGYAGRIYFNPARARFNVGHIAASIVSENMSRKTRFFSHPESRVTNVRLVDTGLFDDVSNQKIYAVEIAGAVNSFMFRSEFFRATWNQSENRDPLFKGFYAQASWILTGETFKYTQGKFLRIRPQNPRGAWEAAVRFSRVNLNDRTITGGEERNLTFALNWYSSGNQFRLMSNLIFVRTDENAGNEDPTIFQLRAQLHW